jgi:4-hydroxy-2-oxoheptanedioate aldolase
MSRVTRWSKVENYVAQAHDEICVLVQAESKAAMTNLAEIAAVDGIDGVFFGPADLSASMGYPGQPSHPEVLKTIDAGIATVLAAGKAPGIIDTDPAVSERYLRAGALFVAVGVEADLLIRAATDLAGRFKR